MPANFEFVASLAGAALFLKVVDESGFNSVWMDDILVAPEGAVQSKGANRRELRRA